MYDLKKRVRLFLGFRVFLGSSIQYHTMPYILGVTGFLSVTRIAKMDKKIFSDYGLDTTKTVSCKVSDGVGVGTVWQAT